ncbi:MAG TPA: branched-chain amino acid aminotransferase [Candidatus Flavonifractor intestinipullorum]|uniref:branched-chain-amino-acid transaminase n=1 Tax=Candidatus Flavonifractor intestinipullorum TaxID=2838587 RepID=A0A9D2S6N3_9FIRM|nr:branched-chain amino acid aminotransferase [Candidatus Flavonifractor intestinipullorum]
MYEFPIQRAAQLKEKPDPKTLIFGRTFTDHMFLMNYDAGRGWHDGRIVPYAPLELAPSAMVFHYAQEVFEGLKAYRAPDGGVQLFRPADNGQRLADSCERLCIPPVPVDEFVAAVEALVRVEADWVPSEPGTSLYIRPFIIATDPSLGVHASHSYLFCIICCPVGAYYAEGINPVRIYVENEDVRAVRGGTGYTKCGGNYAASIRAGERAEAQGYAQVLWLDGVERKYIEEVGSMNVMFKVDGKIITPKLTGSVLPGITRRSCIQLIRDWGLEVEERLITAQELFDAAKSGKLEEAWGTGTAAVVSPVGEMTWNDQSVVINGGRIGPVTQKLYDTLTGIQWGTHSDPHGWVVRL